MVELVLLASLGAFFSAISGPIASALSVIGLYLIGHGAADLWLLASNSKSEFIKVIGHGLYWIIPQLDRLDYRGSAAYDATIDWNTFAVSALYAMGYSGLLLVAAAAAFRRIDFK